jgi:hypothetical protein
MSFYKTSKNDENLKVYPKYSRYTNEEELLKKK